MLKVDPREIYLKRLLMLQPEKHSDFLAYLDLARMVLDDFGDDESEEQIMLEMAVEEFLDYFKTEKGRPALPYVLWMLDGMRENGKRYFIVKTHYVKRKYTYQQVVFFLTQLSDFVKFLVRKKAKEFRITNPEISAM